MYVKANFKKKGDKNNERPCWALIYSVFIHWRASNWKRDARKHSFFPSLLLVVTSNKCATNKFALTHNRIILFFYVRHVNLM